MIWARCSVCPRSKSIVAFRDFQSKQSTTWHLRTLPPDLVGETPSHIAAGELEDTR